MGLGVGIPLVLLTGIGIIVGLKIAHARQQDYASHCGPELIDPPPPPPPKVMRDYVPNLFSRPPQIPVKLPVVVKPKELYRPRS